MEKDNTVGLEEVGVKDIKISPIRNLDGSYNAKEYYGEDFDDPYS